MFFLVTIMLKYVNENPSIHNNSIKYLGLKFLQVVKRDKNLLHSTFAIDPNLLGVDLFVQNLIKCCNSLKKKFLFDYLIQTLIHLVLVHSEILTFHKWKLIINRLSALNTSLQLYLLYLYCHVVLIWPIFISIYFYYTFLVYNMCFVYFR